MYQGAVYINLVLSRAFTTVRQVSADLFCTSEFLRYLLSAPDITKILRVVFALYGEKVGVS